MRSICSPVILACVVLALLAIPAAASALTVTGISPARAYVNSAQSFDVYGTGFVAGAQVGLAGGGTTIEATQETFVSSTRIRCTLSIPAVTDTGPYDVGVVNPGGAAGYRADAFTVYPRPTVTSVSPVSAAPGDTVTVFLVTGAASMPAPRCTSRGDRTTTVYGTSETLIKPNQIRCTLAIPASAYIGLYDVYVTNHPDLDYLLGKAGAFSVVALTPTITGISPATAVAGETPTVDVFGTGFANGAEVIVQGGPSGGSTQIVATGETFVSPTQVRCTLAIPADAYIGSYTAFVRNSGGEWVYRSNAFTVIAPTPSDVSFFPNRGAPGETLHVTVFGSGLVKGVQVTMIGGHSPDWMEIPWTDVTWVSPTEIGCTLNIPTNAYPGSHDVSVRNPGGDWVRAGVFDVIPPTPTVSGISPGMALPGQVMQIVYVTGTGFANGAAVRITGGTGGTTTVNASGETWVNASAIRCSITVPLDAWPGPYAVEVQNLYGTRVSKPGAFAVVAPDPTILGISPLSAYPGNNVSATVTGTRFTRGAEVALAGPDGSVINATDETWVSPTAIRCTLTVPAGAAIATYDLGSGTPADHGGTSPAPSPSPRRFPSYRGSYPAVRLSGPRSGTSPSRGHGSRMAPRSPFTA